MMQPITNNRKINLVPAGKFFLMGLLGLFIVSCNKEAENPVTTAGDPPAILNFRVSASKLVLLQGNQNVNVLTLSWNPLESRDSLPANYTIESAVNGSDFSDMIEMISTNQTNISFTVKDINQQMCKLIPAGASGVVQFRVRAANDKASLVYSKPVALQVTTYQNFIQYDLPKYMNVPGNYQHWNITFAPHIVSPGNNGEYEGYINFTDAYTQFLMVKDISWNPATTYTYIGGSKFGFSGSVFSIFGGAGVYLLKANTNSNTWDYTKINSWGLHGSAVTNTSNTDPEMSFDADQMTWTLKLDLQKGDLRFRANNSNNLSLGKTIIDGYTVPACNGNNFSIDKPGNYTIILNLKFGGNYACSIIKNLLNP